MKNCNTPADALASLVGNEQTKASLASALAKGHLSHSVLLCGEEGTGTGFAARCLASDYLYPGAAQCAPAQAIQQGKPCAEVLVLQGSGASGDIKIDDVRQVRKEVFNTALSAEGRVVLLYGAHRLNNSSANALLKVMEEPPEGVLFVLTAPGEAAVLPTIRSRCAVYTLAPVSVDACTQWLQAHCPEQRAQAPALSALFGGKIGSAVRCIRQPEARKALADARALAVCACKGSGYEAMVLAARYEKDRAGAVQWLELFCQVCAWALQDASAPLPAALAARAIPLAQQAVWQLRANVNAKLALAVFALRLCEGGQAA